jgi:Mor family transcriptional regulator
MTNKPARERLQPFYLEESLLALSETARDVLVDLLGLDEAEASRLGREIMVRVAEDHPGQNFYLAKGQAYQLDVRDQAIYAKFNGRNHAQLAREFKVTPRHIRRVVKRAQAIDMLQRMDDMFPGRDLPDRH